MKLDDFLIQLVKYWKGLSNESTAEVLKIQPATLRRWLTLGANQCDKVNATLMKDLNVQRIEMDEMW